MKTSSTTKIQIKKIRTFVLNFQISSAERRSPSILADKFPNFQIILLAYCLLLTANCFSQDIHFSQYFNSPLTLNPANTGLFKGQYRFAANYRNQWASVIPHPYETTGGSVDATLRMSGKNSLGLGLMLFNDKSGNNNLSNNTVMVSVAYHTYIDSRKKQKISVGIQAGMVSKRIDYTNLTFQNQFNSVDFDPDKPSRETQASDKLNYMDFQIGGIWSNKIDSRLTINVGGALYHLTQPEETFFNATGNKLNMRKVLYSEIRYVVNPKTGWLPTVIFMNQTKAQEIIPGSYFYYKMGQGTFADVTLMIGAWYRASLTNSNSDAMIPSGAVKYKNVQVGISYDVNVSSLRGASNFQGGPEISIIYIIEQLWRSPVRAVVPCLRF